MFEAMLFCMTFKRIARVEDKLKVLKFTMKINEEPIQTHDALMSIEIVTQLSYY